MGVISYAISPAADPKDPEAFNQNGVVAGSTASGGATLLAVGAVIAAAGSGNAAPQVYVSVDERWSPAP